MLKQGVPRHEQISNWIRKQIETGAYEIDEKLPSENEFADRFEVSRVTVRRALQTIESEGRIYRRQGLGSFVKDNRPRQSMVRLTDFVEDMKRAGMEASSSVIQFKPVPAPKHIAPILKIESGDTLVRLDRLRLGDDQPIAFDCTWLPMFYGQLIENLDLETDTIYRILEQEYDIPVEKGCYRIKAKNADEYLAKHLNVSKGQALLLIDRLSLTIGEKPIYYQQRYYRTDRIVYELMLEREQDSKTKSSNMPLKEFLPIFSNSP